ncbi:peptidyl-prolyl cis-trans isomerase B [bacterium BMS3Bbin11]|nr:peptidyl-prolyl cis-trans isomerase B [bacterium BMS3Abin11]GBE45455.1 peptidyl-prolyl cis-trans isomerase B [bacterium BMS3Bbin11]GMT40741.1 MAG: peptidyl-prolyl cis-trans isomerase [bacterium]HDH08075.1 peptidyl-prolyl cis-trans isomerase [Gammaproteobacteria bacterium]HDH15192.1 peptidyl-prolyl cis-trans isomerase [Gammaproteobacteria bacterium]
MIKMETNHGTITIEMDADKAPLSVDNFKKYLADEFFDNTIFHRVIPNFMIQGGGFNPGMIQKQTLDTIENEADNGLTNDRGTIAMARTNDPHSASSQFFINLKDNAFLNHSGKNPQGWGYCVFARVTDGMDVVDKIATVATGNSGGHGDVPVEDVVILKVEETDD